jgi:multidrug transporter EmrE-like cation transporter
MIYAMNIGILFLLASSVCDAVWNICLKQSKGITDWLVNIIGISFLLIGIVTFKKALDYFPLSIAVVIWFGVTFVLTTILDVFLFKTALNYKVAFCMCLCVISIIGLNYFSPAK